MEETTASCPVATGGIQNTLVQSIELQKEGAPPARLPNPKYSIFNKNQIKCSLGCSADETQNHIFEECQPILDLIGESKKIKLNSVFGTLEDQKSVIPTLMHIEAIRVDLIKTFTQNT